MLAADMLGLLGAPWHSGLEWTANCTSRHTDRRFVFGLVARPSTNSSRPVRARRCHRYNGDGGSSIVRCVRQERVVTNAWRQQVRLREGQGLGGTSCPGHAKLRTTRDVSVACTPLLILNLTNPSFSFLIHPIPRNPCLPQQSSKDRSAGQAYRHCQLWAVELRGICLCKWQLYQVPGLFWRSKG